MSPLRFRARRSLGPVRLNFTLRGLSSIALKAGPFTWNATHDRLTTNLPGGFYHQADLRPTGCRCGCPAGVHNRGERHAQEDGSRCPCRRYRRTR